MAGTYVLGETKVRPGAYFNIQKKGTGQQSGTVSGVTAVLFRSDFGPLNTAVELNPDDGFANTFGNGGTTDAIQEAINGGAQTIIACRVGNGGTSATATLNTAEGQAAVKITAAYPGKKAFTVTVREKLTDSTLKECIIYAGVTEFEKVEFTAGAGEAKALADAFAATKKFKAEVQSGKDQAIVMNVSQNAFTPGTDPQVTNEDYSNGFVAVEPYEFNTICVDTEETAVHILMQSFMKRIFGVGSLTQGVVAEKHTVFAFEIRPLSEEEYNKCKKKHTKYVRNKQFGMKLPEETNTVKFRDALIYTATVEADREKLWDNKKVWESLRAKDLQIMNGLDVIEYCLKAGEKDKIIECIDSLSGFEENIEEVAKN